MLNKVIISLGSNQDKEKNIAMAGRLLGSHFDSIHFSEAVYTQPFHMENPALFLNQVAIAFTAENPDQIVDALKQMERQLGRTPEDKSKGNIPIDIDLLQWNDKILKPSDFQRPYIQSALAFLSGTGQEDNGSNQ